ncbi:malonyl-CoA synthase [Bradyrhizobium sp. LjRoot220]|uniref:malonate--CoA ligase n=1 Tax=Bradyrhizobium sp. LjRoot220 TaxID=3342284 RepID=UPI003ECD7A28
MSSYLFSGLFATGTAASKPLFEMADGSVICYGEAISESSRFANALIIKGVKPNDRVAVQVNKSPEAVMLYLACLRVGAIFLPLNTAYTAAELDHVIGDAEPAMFVCAPERSSEIRALAERLGASLETLGASGDGTLADLARCQKETFVNTVRTSTDLAAILYTSGTTGRPKGAMLSHGCLLSNALTLRESWRVTPSDRLLHALPIFHTHGLFVAINVMVAAGATMIFLPNFDSGEIIRLMSRATMLMGVPTFYVRLLQHQGLTRELTGKMRLFISGSAPLEPDTHRLWQLRTGHQILERYGMTETNMITSNPCDGLRLAGSVGQPLPGVSLRIVDQRTGGECGLDSIGTIEVKSPGLFTGYWRDPIKTAAEFKPDGYFVTGDLGRIDEQGYVRIVGRGKDLIITGGFNVYPKEVEEAINALPGVRESAVVGVPHPDFGEGVVAVVVPKQGALLGAEAILHHLRGRLAKFKVPKHLVFMTELPRNAMGKVQKEIIRGALKDVYQTSADQA